MATRLDLDLEKSYNLKVIKFIDLSTYDTTPTNVSFQITPPAGFNRINAGFTPQAINIYTAVDLGISTSTDTNIPDGLYTVKYSVNPNATNNIEKKFMYVENIKCKYQRVFLLIDVSCECNTTYKNQTKAKLKEIKLLIEGAVSSASQCDYTTATEMYVKANCLLDDISSCNC